MGGPRQLLDGYYAGLEAVGFPAQYPDEPDETGARELIDALVVLSDQHLRARGVASGGGATA